MIHFKLNQIYIYIDERIKAEEKEKVPEFSGKT